MLKRYLAWIAFFVLTSIFITGKHEYDTQQNTSQRRNPDISVSALNARNTDHDPAKPNRYAIGWNLAYIVFGWPAGIGVCGLLITFIAIADQAVQTRKSAEASEKQIALQREALRPRLHISEFIENSFESAVLGECVNVRLKISNSGSLPAYGVIVETWMEFLKGMPYRFSPQAKYHKAAPIIIDSSHPQGFEIPFNRRLNATEISQMRTFEGTVCFRLRMTYFVYSNEVFTDHAFAMCRDIMKTIPEYTSAT